MDVLAHEFAHAETAHRVGYYQWQFSLPIWFKEGVAMQVDHRKEYRHQGRALPEVFELDSLQKFNSGNIRHHYMAAKVEVEHWLSARKYEGLYQFLLKVKQGYSFDELYHAPIN